MNQNSSNVILYGRVAEKFISPNNEKGFVIECTHRDALYQKENRVRYERIKIVASTIIMGELIDILNIGDMVSLNGEIMSRKVFRNFTCKYCNEANEKEQGLDNYVLARSISIHKDISSEREKELLREMANYSDTAVLIGNVVNEPKVFKMEKSDNNVATFRLAINHGNSKDKDENEFIWVKAYRNEVEKVRNLKVSDKILVYGFLRKRNFERTKKCDKCGKENILMATTNEMIANTIARV